MHLGLVELNVGSTMNSLAADPGGKGVLVPGPLSDLAIQLLAAGHARGGPKNLIVPYIQNGLEVDLG
jgi:fructose-1-phosphate kinase PfkB-like protein